MGRIRKFTQEAYDALQSGVSDDGEILDFFSDIPLNISNFFNSLELEDDLSNFQSYLRDISDFENYTAKKIDDIFRDVINVDETYATIFRDFNDRMTDFDTIINKLKESISDVNFENNFSKDGFINSLPKETENIIGVNWKNILDKDADDISDEEYNMIAEYIIKNGDADILEEILVDCYTIKKPKNGERNPVVFDNGIEGKTEKYWYSLNKKYNGLSAAINRVTQIWIAIGYTSESDERNRWISTAAQYNTFFKEFGKNKDLVMVREIKLDGTIKELYSNLIDIKNNKAGDLTAVYYPYFSQPTIIEGEVNNKKVMTTSFAGFDQGGQDDLANKGIKYIRANAGVDKNTNMLGTLSDSVVNQITSSLIGKIPGSGIISSVCDICDNSESKLETAETISVSEFANHIGWIVDEFGLICVANDVNENPETCKIYLYPGPETKKIVESYNKYMKEHRDFAIEIGYPKDGINMSWFNKTKKYEDIYIILNSIKIMNRDPLIFNVIENYNEGE